MRLESEVQLSPCPLAKTVDSAQTPETSRKNADIAL